MKADSSDVLREYGQHWSTNPTWAIFQDIRLLRRVLLFLHFHTTYAAHFAPPTSYRVLQMRHHLRHEHAQLLCALWRHRHARFVGGITDLDVCEVLQEQVRAKHTCLWTQIRLRFEASYNTRGPIRQRHLSLRKRNSFNCTRLGSPALVEGQWPWGHVWRCGKRYENVWN